VIPRNVRFLDGSAFCDTALSSISISIEIWNERFVSANDLLIDIVDHTLIRIFSTSQAIVIPRDIEILGSCCFGKCESVFSVSLEPIHDGGGSNRMHFHFHFHFPPFNQL
jgi:hypothetical protein